MRKEISSARATLSSSVSRVTSIRLVSAVIQPWSWETRPCTDSTAAQGKSMEGRRRRLGGGGVRRLRIDLRIPLLHVHRAVLQIGKAELAVQAVGVARRQMPAAQALQVRMREDHLHQPFAQPAPAELFEDE